MMNNFDGVIIKEMHKVQLAEICSQTNDFKYITKSLIEIIENLNEEKTISEEIFKRNIYLLDCFSDKVWEFLNTGHWKDIKNSTKEMYGIINLLKAQYLLISPLKSPTNFERALYCLDIGILLGGSIRKLGNILQNGATVIHQQLPKQLIKMPSIQKGIVKNNFKKSGITTLVNMQTIQYFRNNFFIPKIPVVLNRCIEDWPALQKWNNLNYLIETAGNRLVPVEVGRNYTKENWSQKLMIFRDFLLEQFDDTKNLKENSRNDSQIKYLAQHNLFDQIVELKNDIRVPDYCCLSDGLADQCSSDEIDIKAWFGPGGTVSPMHYDIKNNLLCQVVGQKKITLAAPDDTPYLYPHENFMLENTSQIDCDHIDFERFPEVKHCNFFEFILSEGETVYIPPKWWHHIRSLSNSFSVSFWWE